MIDWSKPPGPSSPQTTTTSPTVPTGPQPVSGDFGVDTAPPPPKAAAPVQPDPFTQTFGPEEKVQDPFQLLSGLIGGTNDIGDVAHSIGGWANTAINPISPVTATATVLSHIPLAWVPGGANDQFEMWGQKLLQSGDTESYAEWQRTKAAADADALGGGNLKADFNLEATKAWDDKQYDSVAGANPHLFLGSGGFGSVGGALASAFHSFLGEAGIAPNEAAAKLGLQDENGWAYKRLQNIRDRYDSPDPADREGLTPVEQLVGQGMSEGKMSSYHAAQLLIREGAGWSSNPFVNIVATLLTDPTTYTPFVAGRVAKMGEIGSTLISQSATAANRLEKTQMALGRAIDAHPKIFQFARATLGADPLGAYAPPKQSAGAQGMLDLEAGHAVDGWARAHGPANVIGAARTARELGVENEFNQAVANAALHQSKQHLTWMAGETAIREGKVITDTADEVGELLARNTPASQMDDIVDFIVSQKVVPTTAEELDDLAARIATFSGKSKEVAQRLVSKMNDDSRAIWHSVTYDGAYKDLEIAKQSIDPAATKLPLDRIVLMNDRTLDDATRQAVVSQVRAAIKSGDLKEANRLYDEAAKRYTAIGQYGYAPGGEKQLTGKVDFLEQMSLPRSLDPDELAQVPEIGNVLGRHFNGSKPLYRVGFRPEEEVGWGMGEDAITGELRMDRLPLISRRFDATLPPQKFHDVVRNSMGQIVGTKAASVITRPVESMSGLFETSKDIISGRRVYLNWESGFINNMKMQGVNETVAKDIFRRIGERVGSRFTTVRAANLQDARTVLDEIAAEGRAILPDGRPMSSRDLLLALLEGSKGDVRVVGLGTSLSQRMRNMIVRFGDKDNKVGEFTVTQYLNFRYRLNLMFGTQRALEGPYYAVVYGAAPLLRPAFVGKLEDTELILRNLGNTSLGRHFAMDATEYAVRTNFATSLAERMAYLSGNQSRWAKAAEAIMGMATPSVRNSMVALTHNNLGLAVREVLEDVQGAIAKSGDLEGVPEQLKILTRTWDEVAKEASARAGRTLDENEIGLYYIQEMFASARRYKPIEEAAMKEGRNPIDVSGLLHEKTWMEPSSLGELKTIHPDALALEIGASRGIFDARAMREALRGKYSPKTGEMLNPVDMKWLRTEMEALHLHPDAIRRAETYFGGDWKDFWDDMARPISEGGMDISPRAAEGAKEVIRQMAAKAEMDPWEFLSSVVGHSVTGRDVKTVMGDFAKFLQGNPKGAPLREWIRHFNSVALQESGARALINEFDQALPGLIEEAKKAGDTVAQAKWEQAAAGLKGEVGKTATPGERPIFGQSPGAKMPDIEGVPTPKGQMTLDEAIAYGTEEIPHDLKVVARGAYGEPGYHYVVKPKTADGVETVSPRTFPTAQEAIDAGHVEAQRIATDARKAAGEPTHREASVVGRAATRQPTEGAPRMGQGFDAWRNEQWDRLKTDGTPVPPTDGLFRAMSDAEFEAASAAGEFKPLLGKDLYVTKDADRLAGGAYGGKSGGYIVEFDPSVATHTTTSRTVSNMEEIAIESAPDTAVRRVWKYDPATKDHMLVLDDTGVVPAAPTTGNKQLDFLQSQYPIDKPPKFDSLPDAEGQAGEYVPSEGVIRVRTGRMKKWLTEEHSPEAQAKYREKNAHMTGGAAERSHVADTYGEDAIITHEYGHALADHLHAKDPKGLRALTQTIRNNPPSGRALDRGFRDMEHGGEAFPEALAAITHGEKDKWGLLDFLRKHGVEPKVPSPEAALGEQAAAQAADAQAFKDLVGEAYDEWFEKEVIKRVKSGKPHANDNIEAIARGLADWTRTAVSAAKVQGTRRILKDLTDKLPSDGAAYWNRSEALVHSLMEQKIKEIERDVFRLAEMQTKRSSFARSINHPIFGFYPASYMWGKVFPESVKFLARNPYGITYDIAKVHMLIAAEREMNPDFDQQMSSVDRSEGAFLAGYLTPSLPWESHEIRMSPFGRGLADAIAKGDAPAVAGEIWDSALNTISPMRWYKSLADTGREIGENIVHAIAPPKEEQQLEDEFTQPVQPETGGATASPQAMGPVKGTELGPVLADSMTDLSKVLNA